MTFLSFMGDHPILTIFVLIILFEGVESLIRTARGESNDS